MYTLNETGYSLFFQYNSERGEQQENIENINILYIDENHFNLLIPKSETDRKKDDPIRNNININPLASPSAGAPALKYGDVNTETTSPCEVKALIILNQLFWKKNLNLKEN